MRERVLAPGASRSMPAPCAIADDVAVAKDRGDELGHAAIAAVREDTAVSLAQCLDERAAVVNRIVAIAWPAAEVAMT